MAGSCRKGVIDFYPRSPCGERPTVDCNLSRRLNFYPRSPCGERLTDVSYLSIDNSISIHALLAESDTKGTAERRYIKYFYPRSPCGERLLTRTTPTSYGAFLSTLSLRRATLLMWYQCNTVVFLSTLSLRRATRRVLKCDNRAIISIHALLAESDAFRSPRIALMVGFLSTLSLRRATVFVHVCAQPGAHFYPRSPCGERRRAKTRKT